MSTEGFMGVCRGCGEEIYAPMIRCACPSEEEVEATMSDEWRQAIHDAEYEEQAIERGVDVTYYREVKCRFLWTPVRSSVWALNSTLVSSGAVGLQKRSRS